VLLHPRRPRTIVALGCVAVAVLLTAGTAAAHTIGLSLGSYLLNDSHVRATVTLRTDDAALAVTGLDSNGDGHVSELEISRARPALQADFIDALTVEADGQRCQPTLDEITLEPPDGLSMNAVYDCPREPASTLRFRFGFLDRMRSDHRHLATVHLPGGDVESLVVASQPELVVHMGEGASHGFGSLLRAGILHILTGADHLAFLLALVLGGTLIPERRARVTALVAMLTAFTVGHSASLATATLAGFAPGPRLVEPAVALSVAYVAGENLFQRGIQQRWMLTLVFGFVHGFALAGGLIPLGLPHDELPTALAGFNLGVEAGQLLVLLVLLPPLALIAGKTWYPTVVRVVSGLIVLAGLGWFLQRIL
jgi:hypothetical protein